jgi:hypothetical protein
MAWTITNHGSWSSAASTVPADVPGALALPGSWPWFPRGVVLVADAQVPNLPTAPPPATGATAGTPGTFTPAGSVVPANLAAMAGIVANPATAWSTGESVVTANAAACHWDGAGWVAGVAP